MNILIDVGHPAHVHLFRNAVRILMNRGHRVLFAARDRELIAELITNYGFEYQYVSKARSGLPGLFYELIEHDWNLFRLAKRFKADLLMGTSVSITHVSKLMRAKSIVFNEDDIDYLKSFALLAYPFADAIVIPDSLRDKRTNKYITYAGYQELAYLHPNRFTPDPKVFDELGINGNDKYFVIRLVAFKAHHDVGKKGISNTAAHRLIDLLSRHGKVFITSEDLFSEAYNSYKIPVSPDRIHHVLNYADMLISDSQTMTVEAAVLGTPAIRYDTFGGLVSYVKELESKYGLVYNFLPECEEQMFIKIKELLETPDLKTKWSIKCRKMLADKIDLTPWMVQLIENFPA